MHKHMQHRGASGACRGGVQWRLLAMTSYLPKRSTPVAHCVDPATAVRSVRSESKASTWGHAAQGAAQGAGQARLPPRRRLAGQWRAKQGVQWQAKRAQPQLHLFLFRSQLRLPSCLALPCLALPFHPVRCQTDDSTRSTCRFLPLTQRTRRPRQEDPKYRAGCLRLCL
jgi:hypothetical protein